MMYRRILLVNIGMTLLAGLLVAVGVWVYCDPRPGPFWSWLWQAVAVLVGGLIFQNFLHMRWLQREQVIVRWSPGDEDAYLADTVFELLYFPLKSVSLSATLWFFLGVPTSMLYVRTLQTGWGNGIVVYVLIAAAGALASFVQIFFYRQLLYPRLEAFLAQRGERGRAWLSAHPVPFTVRAKLLLQSFFVVIVVVMVSLAAGYGIDRNELYRTRGDHITNMMELAAPVLETNGRGDAEADRRVLETFGRILHAGMAIVPRGRNAGKAQFWTPTDLDAAREVLRTSAFSDREPGSRWLTRRIERDNFVLLAVQPWDDFGGALGDYLYLFIGAVLVGATLIFGVSVLASHDLSRSVQRIEKWAELLGQGVLDVEQPVPEDDDLAIMIVRLDALRARLVDLLRKMEAGTAGTRALSGSVQEHAVYLRQTIEEDANLLGLTDQLLARLEGSLGGHQHTVGVLSNAAEETMSGALQMGMVLRDLDSDSQVLTETVDAYQGALGKLEKLVASGRADLSAFVQGAEEAKRSLVNLDDVLDHLMETVRRSRQLVLRTNDQSGTAFDAIYRSRTEILQLEDTMRDSSRLIDHLTGTMQELRGVASAIHEVAEDTKLLSLNAAIRSVKAKDEGRSFSVISHTIQDLALETQNAIETLMHEIEGLTAHSAQLEEHVVGLVDSLHAASGEADESAGIWRDSRSDLQGFRAVEERFETFVQELRAYRDGIRLRQGNFQTHTQMVSQLLSDLLGGLEQQVQHIGDIQERANQIRHFSSYQVSKGRFVSDHVDQVRSMTGHVNSFLAEQLRNLGELHNSLDHLRHGMGENVDEAAEISAGLQRLERAIRHFHDAFARFNIGETR